MNIYVDTGFLYALADEDDKNHQIATKLYGEKVDNDELLISDYIFVETCLLLHRKLGKKVLMEFWGSVENGVFKLAQVQDIDLKHAKQIAEKYKDHDFSLVDCVSFAIMERCELDTALAFDKHFHIYRTSKEKHFQVQPYLKSI